MISYMYTIKMKLKNSITQKENSKGSLSKRMSIEKRDYQDLMRQKGSRSNEQVMREFLKSKLRE